MGKKKVKVNITDEKLGTWWETKKDREGSQETVNILEALPQGSRFAPFKKEAMEQTREKLMAVCKELAAEERPLKVEVVRPAWLTAKTMVAAGVAAILIGLAVFLFLTLPGKPLKTDIARLDVIEGTVIVTDPQGKEEIAKDGMSLGESYSVETGEDARAVVALDDGSNARLDNDSELGIKRFDSSLVELEQKKGNIYNEAAQNTDYQVDFGDVTVKGTDSSFNMDKTVDWVRTRVLEGSVEVSVDGLSKRVRKGQEALARIHKGEPEIIVREFDTGLLEDSWYQWNTLIGGDFSEIIVTDEELVAEEITPAPEEVAPPVPPTPQPEPQPQPQPGSEPLPEPDPGPGPDSSVSPDDGTVTPPEPDEVTISTTHLNSESVGLKIEIGGDPDYDSVGLLRSDSGIVPTYPDDLLVVGEKGVTTYEDDSVNPEITYQYRVCLLKNGSPVIYSDALQVTVPPAPPVYTIELSASWTGSGVELSWTLHGDGTGSFDGYFIRRYEEGKPETRKTYLILSQEWEGSALDTNVVPGITYVYRVGLYQGQQVLAHSDTVSVAIPGI